MYRFFEEYGIVIVEFLTGAAVISVMTWILNTIWSMPI